MTVEPVLTVIIGPRGRELDNLTRYVSFFAGPEGEIGVRSGGTEAHTCYSRGIAIFHIAIPCLIEVCRQPNSTYLGRLPTWALREGRQGQNEPNRWRQSTKEPGSSADANRGTRREK